MHVCVEVSLLCSMTGFFCVTCLLLDVVSVNLEWVRILLPQQRFPILSLLLNLSLTSNITALPTLRPLPCWRRQASHAVIPMTVRGWSPLLMMWHM